MCSSLAHSKSLTKTSCHQGLLRDKWLFNPLQPTYFSSSGRQSTDINVKESLQTMLQSGPAEDRWWVTFLLWTVPVDFLAERLPPVPCGSFVRKEKEGEMVCKDELLGWVPPHKDKCELIVLKIGTRSWLVVG